MSKGRIGTELLVALLEIAGRLRIGPATVKTHIDNLFARTGVRDRAQAVRYAYQRGLVPPRSLGLMSPDGVKSGA